MVPRYAGSPAVAGTGACIRRGAILSTGFHGAGLQVLLPQILPGACSKILQVNFIWHHSCVPGTSISWRKVPDEADGTQKKAKYSGTSTTTTYCIYWSLRSHVHLRLLAMDAHLLSTSSWLPKHFPAEVETDPVHSVRYGCQRTHVSASKDITMEKDKVQQAKADSTLSASQPIPSVHSIIVGKSAMDQQHIFRETRLSHPDCQSCHPPRHGSRKVGGSFCLWLL